MNDSFIKILYRILGPTDSKRMLGLVALSFLAGGFQLLSVASVMPFLTILSEPEGLEKFPKMASMFSRVGIETYSSQAMAACAVMVLSVSMANIYTLFLSWLIVKYTSVLSVRLTVKLMRQYAYKSYDFYLSANSTGLVKDVMVEVGVMVGKFIRPGLDIARSGLSILIVSAALIYVSFKVTLSAFLIFGGGYLLSFVLSRNLLVRLGKERIDADRIRFKSSHELFVGQREARLFGCREEFLNIYREASNRSVRINVLHSLIAQTPRQVIEILGFSMLGVAAVIILGKTNQASSLFPVLGIFGAAAIRMLPLIQSLFTSVVAIRQSYPAVERLLPEFFAPEPDALRWSTPIVWGDKLSIKNIHFAYKDTNEKVIDGIDIEIPKNSTIGLVGETGAGKTTLVNIMLGLLEPNEGDIFVDEIKIRDALEAWQSTFGYVPQDIFLLDDTIAANIAFGIPQEKMDLEQVQYAARQAQLDNFVQTMPNGYETRIGERGVRISGGQRQRLGIARALYRDPSVLVFDEATSALDGATENAVMDAVHQLGGKKTLVIIAHRLTTLMECDAIYILENGKIQDCGTYDELLERNPIFQKFATKSS